MKAQLDLSVDCHANGNILIKAGDQTLFTTGNVRELVPFFDRIGMGADQSQGLLVEAMLCLIKLIQEKTDGKSKRRDT